MAFKFSKSILAAASAGLVAGALAGCGGSAPPPETPEAGSEPMADVPAPDAAPADPAAAGDAAAAAEGKACCKAMNECKGKGGCKAGAHSCHGQNECKGQGGCNAHCPK